MAGFQLPRETAWALKLVQAAVVSNSPYFKVIQTRRETRFHFRPDDDWNPDNLRQAFLNPEPTPCRSLDSLKRGLWFIGLREKRAFMMTFASTPQALIWNGEDFFEEEVERNEDCCLTLAHPSGLHPLRDFIGIARLHVGLQKELQNFAYSCPIPVTLDERRVDSLILCPSHGFSSDRHPSRLLPIRDRVPDFPLLAFPRENFQHFPGLKALRVSLAGQLPGYMPPKGSLACLITIRAQRASVNSFERWDRLPIRNLLYWVMDGVVIAEHELTPKVGPVGLAVFASAEGLETDLTGFNLAQNETSQERLRQVLKCLRPRLEKTTISLHRLIEDSQARSRLWGRAVFAVSLFIHPIAAVFGSTVMIGSYFLGGSEDRQLEGKLNQDFQEVVHQLPR